MYINVNYSFRITLLEVIIEISLKLYVSVLQIRDVYPGSRIQKQQQKRGVQKICCYTFLCRHKFLKIENYFCFEVLKKKIWTNFQRIIEFFTQKIVSKLSKIWVWDPGSKIRDPEGSKIRDPGSGVRDPEETYSGSRIQGSNRHRIPDPDPQH
jgi:hypothetical protein